MQQRSLTKDKFPGKWDLAVAGHISFGEDAMSAAIQETMEEIGYVLPRKLTTQNFRYLTCFRSQIKVSENYIENQFYDFFVLNKHISQGSLILQKSEVLGAKYVSIPELLSMRDKGLLHPRTEWIEVLIRHIKKS